MVAHLATAPTEISLLGRRTRGGLVTVTFFIAALAAFVFFFHLGDTPLNDWDEAWHAQVSAEILQTGDWMSLHFGAGWSQAPNPHGAYYFNKPPFTFWCKAIAFKLFGVTEFAARFFPALFGWGVTVLAVWFCARHLGAWVGLLLGLILCGSWLFVLYHAGRSAEADSTLLFFTFATLISLFYARHEPRWFYIAAICTAGAWFCKTSSAYLPWPAAVIAILIERPRLRVRWRHFFGGLALAWALTLPWQIDMILLHGHAFTDAFYWGEGAKPLTQVIEGHRGTLDYYLQMHAYFFQPWLGLAIAAFAALIVRQRLREPAIVWIGIWTALFLLGVSLFATKLIWYGTPALLGMACLAAWAVCRLGRTTGGLALAIAAAIVGCWQNNDIDLCKHAWWYLAVLPVAAGLIGFHRPRWPWTPVMAVVAMALPLTLQYSTLLHIERGGVVDVAEWDWDLRSPDMPWRTVAARIAREIPHRQSISLYCFAWNRETHIDPSAYFYLHRACPDSDIRLIDDISTSAPTVLILYDTDAIDPQVRTRLDASGYRKAFREDQLVIYTPKEQS